MAEGYIPWEDLIREDDIHVVVAAEQITSEELALIKLVLSKYDEILLSRMKRAEGMARLMLPSVQNLMSADLIAMQGIAEESKRALDSLLEAAEDEGRRAVLRRAILFLKSRIATALAEKTLKRLEADQEGLLWTP